MYVFEILASRAIDWYIYGSNRRGGVEGGVRGGPDLFRPPSKIALGHSYEILNISSESSAQAQSIGTLFEQIGLRGGLWTRPKVRSTRARVQVVG